MPSVHDEGLTPVKGDREGRRAEQQEAGSAMRRKLGRWQAPLPHLCI